MTPTEALARWPLFALLGPDWLAGWVAGGEEQALGTGDVLCQAGDYGRWVYVVRQGRFRVVRPTDADKDAALGFFQAGDVFGEYALLRPGTVAATCRAAGPARVLRLRLRDLKFAVGERAAVRAALRPWVRLHALVRFLRDGTFLGFMSVPSFVPLRDRFREVAVPAGCIVQTAGLGDDGWFFVRRGEVRVGNAIRGPFDGFGEAALAGDAEPPSAVAVTDVEASYLTRADFLAPLDDEGPGSLQTLAPPPPRQANYPFVPQTTPTDCGPASLAMVGRDHGKPLSPAEVRAVVPIGPRGCSMADLRSGAESLGFRASAVCIGPEQLPTVRLPAVALLGAEHYVVLYAHRPGEVVVGDPAAGVKTLPEAEFRRDWHGHLLVLTPPAGGESVASVSRPRPAGG